MWPERLLQVARNIKGMIDDSRTAAFYQLAQLCEIHDLEDLERYDGQFRNVVKYLSESSRSLMDVAVNLSTPHSDELLSSVEDARSGIENISSTMEATPPIARALLSSVSLFMDVRMKDITLCLVELLERGWIGGVEKRRGRDVIRLRQPQLEHIQGNLRGKMGGSDVTVESAMEEMDLDYFTAYHIVKRRARGARRRHIRRLALALGGVDGR